MNIQEKKLIDAFYEKENAIRHNKAVSLLFYGRVETDSRGRETHVEFGITRSIKNAVAKYYSGPLYAGRNKEVYDTFVSLFHDYLLKLSRESFDRIENLQSWMFEVARNFANKQRKQINDLLGIQENVISMDPKYDVSENEESVHEQSATTNDYQINHQKVPDSEDDAPSAPEQSSKWAEDLIEEYIRRIPNPYYRLVLNAINLHGMSMEDFAEDQEKKLSAIHNDHKRAMDALIRAALPDIRWRAPKLFDSFRDFLDSSEIDILDGFFKRNETKDISDLVKAYVKLLKVSKRERLALEQAERKEARLNRRNEKE